MACVRLRRHGELAEALNLDLSDEDLDYDTLGGLVFSQLSVIPDDGSRPIVEALGTAYPGGGTV